MLQIVALLLEKALQRAVSLHQLAVTRHLLTKLIEYLNPVLLLVYSSNVEVEVRKLCELCSGSLVFRFPITAPPFV